MLVRTEAVHFSHPTFPTSPLKLLTQTGSHRLVDAGNPPHRHTACAAAHRACPYHCLVALEAGPSSRRKALIPETKNATVVLAKDSVPSVTITRSDICSCVCMAVRLDKVAAISTS